MPTLNGEEWLGFRRPFRGSPQQGTLFDVKGVPSEPVDSPGNRARGRRQEMLDAMPRTKVYETEPLHQEVREKRRERGIPEWVQYPESYLGNTATDRAGLARRAEMSRELADKTTVDPADLQGLAQISEGHYAKDSPPISPSAVAHYDRRRHANGPVIESHGRMGLGTLTHEIGHHVSRHHRGTPPIPPTSAERENLGNLNIDPAEEARADAYALRHAPEVRDYTYASLHPRLADPGSQYRQTREDEGEPLREWEGGSRPDVGQQFEPLFQTESAIAPEADAEVLAFTRNEGRDVLGWSPTRGPHTPITAIQKNEYDPEYKKPFHGANYVTMFNDDVIPDRFDQRPEGLRQLWK